MSFELKKKNSSTQIGILKLINCFFYFTLVYNLNFAYVIKNEKITHQDKIEMSAKKKETKMEIPCQATKIV